MLGSLAFWYFSGNKSFTHVLLYETLDKRFSPGRFKGSFDEVLPILETSYTQILAELRSRLPASAADDFVSVIGQLCHPNPHRRGHPREMEMKMGRQYSLERYISSFMRLSLKLEKDGK